MICARHPSIDAQILPHPLSARPSQNSSTCATSPASPSPAPNQQSAFSNEKPRTRFHADPGFQKVSLSQLALRHLLLLELLLLGFECGLGLVEDGFEGRFISHGEVGEDLAIEFETGGFEALHESAVGEA